MFTDLSQKDIESVYLAHALTSVETSVSILAEFLKPNANNDAGFIDLATIPGIADKTINLGAHTPISIRDHTSKIISRVRRKAKAVVNKTQFCPEDAKFCSSGPTVSIR